MTVKTSPLVSVLMPVFNAERYVAEAIESILRQSFQDFEFIIIDDGSTDGTLDILKRYAARDSRIRLVSRENRGLVATLNEGIGLARGQWIARMDADDVALPQRLALQVKHLEATHADFCGGSVECFGGWRTVWRYPATHEACEVHLLFAVPVAHPTVIGRREAFAQLRYQPEFPYAEDYDLWQRAWAAGYRFVNVPEIVLRYRIHAGQVSSRKKKEQKETSKAVRIRHWQALLPDLGEEEVANLVQVMDCEQGKTDLFVPVFERLLAHYSGEAREILLSDIYWIFRRLAGGDRSSAWNWVRLTSSCRYESSALRSWMRASVIAGISVLHLRSGSQGYHALRRLRNRLTSFTRF
ncbi:MAG: fucosyltransferase [Thermosynechococcus sp.]|uniref:glycosyltransferase family 2 protein n=1 Tax=Thermosynechococcus sp. TaxID=2814275 RepID=UPI00220AEC82|nr:glycosyltransferase [Thermosynechococcus sp.]BCX12975.1 MAG: fucosyltransferase [Thermosynechococcus sp.]